MTTELADSKGNPQDQGQRQGRRRWWWWHRRNGIWRELVGDHVAMLRTDIIGLPDGCPIRKAINERLDKAEEAADAPSGPIFWWRGTLVDRGWFALHTAEVLIAQYVEPPQRAAERWQLVTGSRPGCEVPWGSCQQVVPHDASYAIARSIEHQHDESDRRYTQTRMLRNRLLIFSLLGLATIPTLIALAFTGLLAVEHMWGWPEFGLIALFGAVGAYVVHLPSVINATASRSPYSLAAQQLLVKLAVGPLFAVLGVMLLQSALIDQMRPFEDFGVTVLVYATIFGGSQQVLTGFIDRRASRVLEGDDDGGGHCCTRPVTRVG